MDMITLVTFSSSYLVEGIWNIDDNLIHNYENSDNDNESNNDNDSGNSDNINLIIDYNKPTAQVIPSTLTCNYVVLFADRMWIYMSRHLVHLGVCIPSKSLLRLHCQCCVVDVHQFQQIFPHAPQSWKGSHLKHLKTFEMLKKVITQ